MSGNYNLLRAWDARALDVIVEQSCNLYRA